MPVSKKWRSRLTRGFPTNKSGLFWRNNCVGNESGRVQAIDKPGLGWRRFFERVKRYKGRPTPPGSLRAQFEAISSVSWEEQSFTMISFSSPHELNLPDPFG
jgi:hypothetical protein